jgi:hypothetical protein
LITNDRLVLPYAAPYCAFVALATLGDGLPKEVNYLLRIVSAAALLAWGWRWYLPLRGPGSLGASLGIGAAVGAAGTGIWIALLYPFVGESSPAFGGAAFALRLSAATLIVPLFEELLMRGFIFRLALQWDRLRRRGEREAFSRAYFGQSIDEIRPGEWSFAAVGISTAAFALGHQVYEWPAAIAYGLLMSVLYIIRKDLAACVAAHAATNFSLGLFVCLTGQWQYW